MKMENTSGPAKIETDLPKIEAKPMPIAEQKKETFESPEFHKKTQLESAPESKANTELDFKDCGRIKEDPDQAAVSKKDDEKINFDSCNKKNDQVKTTPEQKKQEPETFELCKKKQDSTADGDNDEATSDGNTDTDNEFNDARLRMRQNEQASAEEELEEPENQEHQRRDDLQKASVDRSDLKKPEVVEKVDQKNDVVDDKKEEQGNELKKNEAAGRQKQEQIKLKEDVEKKRYHNEKVEPEARTFVTNDGETISYEEAKTRICDSAEEHYRKMCEEENRPIDQDPKALRERIAQNLDKMEKTSNERLIGDHGIKHLYGDITRNDETTINGEPMSARGELSKLLMGVHHDDGYTDDRIHQDGASDKDHARYSREMFEKTVQKDGKTNAEFYADYFGKNGEQTAKDIGLGIEAHNIESAETKKIVDVNQALQKNGEIDEVKLSQAEMAINDKLGLDQREKQIEFFEKNPKAMEYAEKLYQLNETNVGNGRGYSEAQKQHIIKEMKRSVRETNFSKNPIENIRLQKSLERAFDREERLGKSDFSLDNPQYMTRNFNAGMNCIEVPKNAVSVTQNEQGKLSSQIKINLLGSQEENIRLFGEKTANRQFSKMVEDMGYKFDAASPDYCGYDSPKAFINAGLSKEGATLKESNMTFFFTQKSFDQLPQDDSRVLMREAYLKAQEKYENSDAKHFFSTMDRVKEIASSENCERSQVVKTLANGFPHLHSNNTEIKNEIGAFYKKLLLNIDQDTYLDDVKKALQSDHFASLQKKVIDDYIRRK